jgi:tRNA nucleotidyltransferase/poly(A) polymerase
MSETGAQAFDLPAFPHTLRAISAALSGSGHRAHWVGPALLEWIEGRRAHTFDLSTDARTSQLTALFPHAIPLANGCGTVMLPSPAGPIDITPYQFGSDIETELAHRDFTIRAIAYDAQRETLLDPFDGLRDLAQGRLRAVRIAADRIDEDPIRALRAIRLAATLGLKVDAALESALPTARTGLELAPRIRIREELVATLRSSGVGQAWPLLEQSGIAEVLAPSARPGSGTLMALLPNGLEIRLAGWLRGARARRTLQKMRFSRPVVERVEHLLAMHPIDRMIDPDRTAPVARLVRRESSADLDAAITLRRTELRVDSEAPSGDEATLDALAAAFAQARAREVETEPQLAVDGSDVMRELACGPGRHVGRALAFLRNAVSAGSVANEPDALFAHLRGWTDGG